MRANSLSKGVASIAAKLNTHSESNIKWILRSKSVCASTEIELSRWLIDKPISKDEFRAIVASHQRFSLGQYNRIWIAPRGGVWLSAALTNEKFLWRSTDLFSLAIAVALAQRMDRKGVNVKIKWPNDLWFEGYKLAGFLPKLIFRGPHLRLARVGIGLNVHNIVPKGAISLKQILVNQHPLVEDWTVEVLIALENAVKLLRDEDSLVDEVYERLWTKEIIDPSNGLAWAIKRVNLAGGLVLNRGSETINWNRWRD